ncbi:MAG TPA: hypothetical protein VMI52_09085, partial [Acetobacteraceae bacterium]|nr:hypothetical protein [Acetobacteraceae bacterium]
SEPARRALNAWIRSAPRTYPSLVGHVIDDDAALAVPMKGDEIWCAGCTADGVHPNQSGMQRLIPLVQAAIAAGTLH